MSLILAPRRLREDNYEFETNVNHRVRPFPPKKKTSSSSSNNTLGNPKILQPTRKEKYKNNLTIKRAINKTHCKGYNITRKNSRG